MRSKIHRGGFYRPLKEEEVERIHNCSLKILERIGFTYESGVNEILALLEDSGVTVDQERSRIFFPRKIVMEGISKAPERVLLWSRDGKNDLDLKGHQVHLGTGGCALYVLDLETGKARPSTLKDIYQIGRLVDGLKNIDFFVRPCAATDIPPPFNDVNVFYACLKATNKHVMAGVGDLKGLRDVLEMASMLAGGPQELQKRPFLSIITAFVISPLKLDANGTLIMWEAVRSSIPVALSCAPMAGSTSPVTMAGTLALTHAEQLAGITLCQLIRPGAPLLYGGIPGMANPRTMAYQGGSVECGMMNAAIHQLADYIGVPNYNSSGLTDSKIPDAQAGWEKAMTTLLAAMAGSNYIHHAAGMLESMLTVAYEQYVMDDEVIGMSCRVLEGIEVDVEHLALDTIESVGPGGNFMTSSHTLRHMRREYFDGSGVTDWRNRPDWERAGSLDARQRARDKVREILALEQKEWIPSALDARIRERFDIRL